MNKSTKIKIYFFSIFILSLIWLLVLPKPFKNLAPIIFIIPTLPVFIFKFYNLLCDFSFELKNIRPDLFQKYVIDYGVSINNGEIVDIGIISKNDDFNNLENKDLYEKYILCKQFTKFAFLSFFIFGVLEISAVCL